MFGARLLVLYVLVDDQRINHAPQNDIMLDVVFIWVQFTRYNILCGRDQYTHNGGVGVMSILYSVNIAIASIQNTADVM